MVTTVEMVVMIVGKGVLENNQAGRRKTNEIRDTLPSARSASLSSTKYKIPSIPQKNTNILITEDAKA